MITLIYEDEIDLNLLPGICGCWTKKGQQKKVPTPGQNQKRYGFGGVNFATGQLIEHIDAHKRSDSFCLWVQRLLSHCPGPVVLVVDNFIIHRSKKTQKVLDRYQERLRVVFLPTYAPQLNPIELLWKHLRRKVTHNHLFESVAQLLEAVGAFFEQMHHDPATVLSLIGAVP